MKAQYTVKGSHDMKNMEYPVIMPQAMTNGEGFTLLGFNDWEDVNDEKLTAAVTHVTEFHLSRDVKMGFDLEKSN